jgi:hypothetical protein
MGDGSPAAPRSSPRQPVRPPPDRSLARTRGRSRSRRLALRSRHARRTLHSSGTRTRAGAAAVSEVANVPISAADEDVTGFRISTSAGATVLGRVEWEGRAPLRITTSAADGRPAIIGLVGAVDLTNGIVGQDDAFRIDGLPGRVLFTPTGVPPRWTRKSVIVDGATSPTWARMRGASLARTRCGSC